MKKVTRNDWNFTSKGEWKFKLELNNYVDWEINDTKVKIEVKSEPELDNSEEVKRGWKSGLEWNCTAYEKWNFWNHSKIEKCILSPQF